MKRRAALAALAHPLGWAVLPARASAASRPLPAALAWGAAGCWVDDGTAVLQRLPDALAAGVDPVPTAGGLWLVDDAGRLRCWVFAGETPWRLQCTVQLGAPVHALAATSDGHWVLAAHGSALSLLDGQGVPIRTYDGADLRRERRGAASALFALPRRRSFAAAWPALGELWEISLDRDAAPIFDGLVHDYRMGEAIASAGYLGVRRAPLGQPLPVFTFADHRVPWLAGALGGEVAVVHLDVRRRIAALRVDGADPAGAALRPARGDRGVLEWWLPAVDEVHAFDTQRWTRLSVSTLPGPVRQLQAVGADLWALVGERAAASAWVLHPEAEGRWRRVAGAPQALGALRADPRGTGVLALRDEPPALLLLDADGEPQRSWPLPPGAAVHRVAWLADGTR